MKKILWIGGTLAIVLIGLLALPGVRRTGSATTAPEQRAVPAVPADKIAPSKITSAVPHAIPSGCAACDSHGEHEHAETAEAAEQPALRLTEAIRQDLFNVGKNSPISFALPGGGTASGTVEMIRMENGRTVMIQGALTTPKKGRFFFQLQSMPGVAGLMVGTVVFDEGDVAYSVEPGTDGEPELRKKHVDEVICRQYGMPVSTENTPEEIPADHPDDIAIPDYQNGIIPLSSLPGALAVAYLDFDGQEGPHNFWGNIDAEPANTGNANVRTVWERVAEDFAPFNINVTTDVRTYENAPKNSRIRCIITPTTTAAPGAGGVAVIGSFNSDEVPCWVFALWGKSCAEAASHEIGHTLKLHHDGRSIPDEVYYGGHGSGDVGWAPLMGVGYYKNLSQWSKGEYLNADRDEDDLSIIAYDNNDTGYRADDHAETLATATYLEIQSDNSVSNEGVVELSSDSDGFRFTLLSSSALSLTVSPVGQGPNLDILAEIVDSTNGVVASDNPDTGITATVGTTLAAGEYLLRVSGVGRGDVLGDGYSDYGSLGFYRVTGTVPNAVQPDRFTIAENPAPAASVGTVSPRNSHGADPLSFAITSGNGSGAFALNATSGELTVADAALFDFEALSAYYDDPATFELFVNITNTNTPALNESIRVVVEVTDINEVPTITGEETVALLEHTQPGTELMSFTGIDPDYYDFTTFAITAGNTGNAFALDAHSGKLTVELDIDAATNPSYTLTVTASDQGTPALTDSTNIVISVVDIAPGYTPGTIAHTYFEGISGGSVSDLTGAPAFPLDPDSLTERPRIEAGSHGDQYGSVFRGFMIPPATGSYTFWIASDDSSRFFLSTDADPANMAEIASVSNWTDFKQWNNPNESNQQSTAIALTAGQPYYLEIRHKEGGGIDHVSAAWQGPGFAREVVPGLYLAPYIPNYAPRIDAATYAIPENAFIGSVVATASVSDLNPGDSHGQFTLIGGDPAGAFAINPASGEITVADTSQLTAGGTFSLQVQTTDNGTPAYSGTGTITVNITTDNAQTEGRLLQEIWTGISGNEVSLLTAHANYPDSPDYTRTLAEFDSGEYVDDSYGSRIRGYVIPPATGSYTFFIASDDNSQLLLSSDADPANAATAATITGWTDHKQWDKFAGQQAAPVSLIAGQKYYIETLHKEGGGGDHVSVGWSGPGITGTAVIDGSYLEGYSPNNAPVWDAPPYAFTAVNTDPAGTTVGTVSATDDSTDALLYNILSGNSTGGFAIAPNTGAITLANPMSLVPGIHVLQVGVQDQGGGTYPFATATTNVTITVSGDNPPTVTSESFNVVENRMAGTLAGVVQATDADAGDTLTYAITAGNGSGAFTINTNSGAIRTTAPLNHEAVPQHILTVEATDDSGFTGFGIITINVTDQDESNHGGVTAWEEQVHTGTTHLHKRTETLAGNTMTTIDLSGIGGDATYEFMVNAKDFGQGWTRLLYSPDSRWALDLEAWNNTDLLGLGKPGTGDYPATAESGQSAASPYGSPVHLVYVVETSVPQTRIYVNSVWVASLTQTPVLTDAAAQLGPENVRNDSNPGILAFAAYSSVMGDAEITTHYHAWFDHLFVDSDADTLDDNWEIAQYTNIAAHAASGNPDGDTLDMFEEMAFGGNALAFDSAGDFTAVSITNDAGGISMIFSYRRAKDRPYDNVAYQFQTCDALEPGIWTDNPAAPDAITNDPDGIAEWVTHIIPIPDGSTNRFFRGTAAPQ